jgi:O-methyltransferase
MLTRTQARAKARRAAAAMRLSSTAREVRRRNLTYLSAVKLRNVEACLTAAVREQVPGDFLEAGVALGGSAIVIAGRLEGARRFLGYDVFGMIPEPGEADPSEVHERYQIIASGESQGIGGEQYYGYRDDLYADVVAAFSAFGVPVDGDRIQLHPGLFEDTLNPSRPIAFAHIDCDWYDPVALCLERIHPHLSPGGWIVADDYYTYGGARRAVDEHLAAHPDIEVVAGRDREHLVLTPLSGRSDSRRRRDGTFVLRRLLRGGKLSVCWAWRCAGFLR